jgi:pyridoxal phosphate enzyme (YggS family)
MTTSSGVAERLAALQRRLNAAAERAGREPDSFRIVAVTKTFGIETCRAALQAGLTRLGENRVQEAEPKIAALPEAEWHLVGRLQSNKARRAVRGFAVIHSIDSVDLLARVDRVAAEEDRRTQVLLEVNVTGEGTKAGFEPDELGRVDLGAHEAAPVIGLMTILPYGAAFDDARRWFRRLRELRDELQERTGHALPELSMGMSGDAEAAVAEGATLVRIGTALFGPREPTLVSSHP